MIHKPYRRFAMDDEYAPVDYNYASSVSEGLRREALKNIHRDEPRPEKVGAAYGRASSQAATGRPAGKLPSLEDGPAPAARIAYPRASQIPENPFAPPPEENAPQAEQRRGRPEPQPIIAEDGSQFDPPAMAQLPEWYRVAQQNSAPQEDSMRRPPRVQAAPRYDAEEAEPPRDILGRPRRSRAARSQAPQTDAQRYEEAGYPAQLVDEQRTAEAEWNAIAQRRRHGAQCAVRDDRRADNDRQTQRQPAPAQRFDASNAEARPAPYPAGEQPRSRRSAYAPARPSTPVPEPAAPPAYPSRTLPPSRGDSVPRGPLPGYHAPASQVWQEDGERYVANPYARNAPSRGNDAAERNGGYAVEEENAEERRGLNIPWLGVAAFAVAFLAVGLWLLQILFDNRTAQALNARQEAAEMILDSHPYEYRELIEAEAARNNLNPAFVAAIIFNESTFRSGAESSVGARGLMQVMSDTADTINKELNVAGYSFDMLYDAKTNLLFGCYYLGELSQRFRGDPILVAAAYHAGPNQVQNWLNTSTLSLDGQSLILDNMADGPTKQYAARVKRDFAIYRRLYYENAEEGA